MAQGDLTTPPNVQAWLFQSGPPPAASAALLTRLITAASQMVSNYCGRSTLLSASYVDTYDGNGRDFMLLRQWPVTAIASIGLTYGSLAGPTTTISNPSGFPGYVLEAALPGSSNQRLTLIGGMFPRGRSNVTVSYTAGYAEAPTDVEQAVIELVGERFKASSRIGMMSETLGGQETTAFSQKSMNDTITALLAPYRRLVPV